MVAVRQLEEVTVMVVDKVLVKVPVKPLAPDLVEEKEVTMEVVMDLTRKARLNLTASHHVYRIIEALGVFVSMYTRTILEAIEFYKSSNKSVGFQYKP
mmetsp:Transcript_29089/g.32644  ORF Transcript_29089/g.32644 Transcript_29089/m.32644 type:complete len:98 (+) Transcript_29089:760-1053(+)